MKVLVGDRLDFGIVVNWLDGVVLVEDGRDRIGLNG